MKFKLPQKYIPERRNFNQDLDDNKSNYSSYLKNDNLNNFDNFSMASLPGGSRVSEFGFINVPDFKPFQKTSCGKKLIGVGVRELLNIFLDYTKIFNEKYFL